MWLGILLAVLAAGILSVIYLIKRVKRFYVVKKLAKGRSLYFNLIGISFVALIFIVSTLVFSFFNAIIIVIHLVMFWLIIDGLSAVIKKLSKSKKNETKLYYEGIIAIFVTIVYLGAGLYLNYHVWEKDYELSTDKNVGNIRIVQFADSHVCTTFDGEGLNEYVDKMNELNPDVILITGDFVDDGTDKDNMIAACKALSRLKARYGVYFSYGNHDKGYYGSTRGFSASELEAELTKNGVIILQDETVLIDDRFYLVGRIDRSESERENGSERSSMKELMANLDYDKYIVVLDHQPHDYKAQSESEADLVLSGHTHGGQLFPITYVGEWTGANDATYGLRRINDTDFIVTSGISDWEIKFKTGCKSEFVVIDIKGK